MQASVMRRHHHGVFKVGVSPTVVSPSPMLHCSPGRVTISPCERITVPSAFVVKSTRLRPMPIGSCLPTTMQLLSSPRLNCSGTCAVNSTVPKSFVFGGILVPCGCWLGFFEQPMTSAAIKATPVITYGMRIKFRRHLTLYESFRDTCLVLTRRSGT